jgi:hypothetical protein
MQPFTKLHIDVKLSFLSITCNGMRTNSAHTGAIRKGASFALALDIRSATSWLRKNYDFSENAVKNAVAK